VEMISVGEAAKRLGVSTDTVRRRIGKGELLAHREPTPQGFRWEVELPDNGSQDMNGHHSSNGLESLVVTLQAHVQTQAEELAAKNGQLEAKDSQIRELHVLLHQTQAALPAPKEKHWWRWW